MSQFDELPEGWEVAKLGEIGIWKGGGTPSKSNVVFWEKGSIPWVSPKDMKVERISTTQDYITEQAISQSSTNLISRNSVLIVTRSGILERTLPVAINICDVAINQDLKAVTLVAIPPELVLYFLRGHEILVLRNCAKDGTTVSSIDFDKLKNFPIPLPPLKEQRRIVAKIEALGAHSRRAREALDAVPGLIEQFRQSVLAAAFRGDLTADWRTQNPDVEPAEALLERSAKTRKVTKNNPRVSTTRNLLEGLEEIPDNWSWTVLENVCSKITDGEHITPPITDEGTPLLSAKDVRDNHLDFSNTKFVNDEVAKKSRSRCNPESGDVLVVSRGATVGRTCLVQTDRIFCLMGSVLLFKIDKKVIDPKIIEYLFKSPSGIKNLSSMSGASAQQAIYIRDMKSFAVPVPPLKEQQEIIMKVSRLFSYINSLEEVYMSIYADIAQLDQSTLAKAFRGELVPQDPNDEPTSVLLERIRAEREQIAATPQAGKRRRKS